MSQQEYKPDMYKSETRNQIVGYYAEQDHKKVVCPRCKSSSHKEGLYERDISDFKFSADSMGLLVLIARKLFGFDCATVS